MTRVRWAVVGTSGFALEWIAPALRAGANSSLAAVVSRDAGRAREAAQRVGAAGHAASIAELDPGEVDGVFLVTPNPAHEPLAVEAAQRGFHVIVEKPMAATVAAGERMVAAATSAGVTLAVAHCMAWAPPVEAAARLIAEGAIGQVLWASVTQAFVSSPPGQWRQEDPTAEGGGPLFDVGSHIIDSLTRMIGPVEQVAAMLDHAARRYPADDLATLLLRLAGPVHAAVHTSFTAEHNAFEIVGTEGALLSQEWIGRSFAGDLRLRRGDDVEVVPLEHRNVYVSQIEHVSDHILNGAALRIGAGAGLATVAVLEAAVRAAAEGVVVTVPTV
jgi:1,5-anhydro-D-fructose reductase (1,5-anhydro-D-mannitol-forming)